MVPTTSPAATNHLSHPFPQPRLAIARDLPPKSTTIRLPRNPQQFKTIESRRAKPDAVETPKDVWCLLTNIGLRSVVELSGKEMEEGRFGMSQGDLEGV